MGAINSYFLNGPAVQFSFMQFLSIKDLRKFSWLGFGLLLSKCTFRKFFVCFSGCPNFKMDRWSQVQAGNLFSYKELYT